MTSLPDAGFLDTSLLLSSCVSVAFSIQESEQNFGVGGFHEVGVEAAGQSARTVVELPVTGYGDEPDFRGSRVHADARATA